MVTHLKKKDHRRRWLTHREVPRTRKILLRSVLKGCRYLVRERDRGVPVILGREGPCHSSRREMERNPFSSRDKGQVPVSCVWLDWFAHSYLGVDRSDQERIFKRRTWLCVFLPLSTLHSGGHLSRVLYWLPWEDGSWGLKSSEHYTKPRQVWV